MFRHPLANARGSVCFGSNYKAKPNLIKLYGHTTAVRYIEQLKKSSSPSPLFRGPSEVSWIVKVIRISRPHDSLPGTSSCCTVIPFPELPVGSNTEVDDDCRRRQFSIGTLPVRNVLSQSHNSSRKCESKSARRQKCQKGL